MSGGLYPGPSIPGAYNQVTYTGGLISGAFYLGLISGGLLSKGLEVHTDNF